MHRELRFCFLMERQVGIGSAAGAIEPYVRERGHVWLDVTYAKPGGVIERLPLPGRVKGTVRGIVQTSTALRSERFDALCFLTHNPAVFQQRALARTPTLLWTDVTPAQLDHQAESYGHPVGRLHALERVKASLVKRTFAKAALCVGWSEWARRSFVDDYRVEPDRTAVIPPGIDLKNWEFTDRSTLPTDNIVRLLFVGGDFERKGGQLLLDVYRQHLRGRCELDLVTRAPVTEEEGVRVHRGLQPGHPRLLELYRRAHAFVLPTLGDCYSIASLEAMAAGLPVLVSKIGGIEDIVDSGESGLLIAPGDAPSLRSALESLLDSRALRLDMGKAGRKRVERDFSASSTAARLLEAMASLPTTRSSRVGASA